MAKSGTRIQVFFSTDIASEIESISKAEGVSLSKVVGDCVECYRQTEDYQSRLTLARNKLDAVKNTVLAAIEGADLSHDKIASILQALEGIER